MYRYSFAECSCSADFSVGSNGGVVVASTLEEAKKKLGRRYGKLPENTMIWNWALDDFYDADNPDVIDCY